MCLRMEVHCITHEVFLSKKKEEEEINMNLIKPPISNYQCISNTGDSKTCRKKKHRNGMSEIQTVETIKIKWLSLFNAKDNIKIERK